MAMLQVHVISDLEVVYYIIKAMIGLAFSST